MAERNENFGDWDQNWPDADLETLQKAYAALRAKHEAANRALARFDTHGLQAVGPEELARLDEAMEHFGFVRGTDRAAWLLSTMRGVGRRDSDDSDRVDGRTEALRRLVSPAVLERLLRVEERQAELDGRLARVERDDTSPR